MNANDIIVPEVKKRKVSFKKNTRWYAIISFIQLKTLKIGISQLSQVHILKWMKGLEYIFMSILEIQSIT